MTTDRPEQWSQKRRVSLLNFRNSFYREMTRIKLVSVLVATASREYFQITSSVDIQRPECCHRILL
jgi:hypothetical protein